MRKIKYFVAALLLGAISVNANPVEVNTAQKVAANYYNHTYNVSATTQTLVYTERSSDGKPVYYVFNINNNQGFVIVSAEDAGMPVIGYSNEGPFVVPVAGNNVDFWMQKRKSEIAAIRAANLTATPEISAEWNSYINNTFRNTNQTTAIVNPLCSTTWDQPAPYNGLCPGGSLTGCVATAMAQIMKFWNYPSVGLGNSCYWDEIAYGDQNNFGELCATYDTSHYVWSAMPNNITTTNKQVSKLMYDCGVSVHMDYGTTGSGAGVIGGFPTAQYAYPTYFRYDGTSIQGLMFSSYTQAAWIAILQKEMNNRRPVQYMGTDVSNGGHSWVCDGYNGNSFHMNWGWSGFDDGNYAVGSLVPSGSGFDFTTNIGAIIGIQPTATAVQQVTNNIVISVYPNPGHGEFTFEIPANMKNAQIRVYSILGQEVNTSVVNSGINKVNLGSQPKGVYLYRLLNENGESVSTGRLVIE